MIVADTDVLIDFLAGQGGGADAVSRELQEGALHTTAVTRFEMLSGARTKRQRAAVVKLLAAVPALPVDEAAADAAAEVRRALDSRGEGIGMADSLIAGTVIRHGGTLLTRNRRHFNRVDGLTLAKLDS
jgi:tRNA(fMet)-specific endonuclease VapC